MSANAPDPREGGDAERRLDSPSRERFAGAMLEACGELGYEQVGVAEVLRRAGGERDDFFAGFSGGLPECYATGYEMATERLSAEALSLASAAADWRRGLRLALDRFASFVSSEPDLARALLIDVHLAGDLAELRRKDLTERLARLIDSARVEPDANDGPPPLTSLFMVSAIESAAVAALVRDDPDSFAAAVPELAQMVLAAYFGD